MFAWAHNTGPNDVNASYAAGAEDRDCLRDQITYCQAEMGPTFVVVFWAILLTPVGLFLGSILTFAGIPICYRLAGIPKEQRRITFWPKVGFTVAFTAVFVPAMCILGVYLMVQDTDDYWKSRGAWDVWRMP
ncbi:MAG: hypothetical protein ACYSWU_21120, partial [Planctomycetota bacterium]